MTRWIVWCFGVCACGSVSAPKTDAQGQPGDGNPVDAPVDAPPPCDLSRPFTAPVPVAGINTTGNETNAWLSSDGLTIYFTRNPVNSIDTNIYRATRAQPS